jgi:hypothetical protein
MYVRLGVICDGDLKRGANSIRWNVAEMEGSRRGVDLAGCSINRDWDIQPLLLCS